VNEYRYEIERLNRELQELKRKYYEQKRREQLAREVAMEGSKHRTQLEQQAMQARSAATRFTGGGFAIR
jgi:hypothetical protein